MAYQDWGPTNAFYNPKPSAFANEVYTFNVYAMPLLNGVKESATNAKAALRTLRFPLKASAEALRDAAVRLRTAALWADRMAWNEADGQDNPFPELKIQVHAARVNGEVRYGAYSTWNVNATAATPRAAIDGLLDQILPKPSGEGGPGGA